MKCSGCGRELEEGKLLCEHCGEEVSIVPDFDIELETEIQKNLTNIVEDISLQKADEYIEELADEDDEWKENFGDYFPHKKVSEMVNIKKGRQILPFFVVGIVGSVLFVFLVVFCIQTFQKNSYDYQYNKAVECATANHYDEAVIYLI